MNAFLKKNFISFMDGVFFLERERNEGKLFLMSVCVFVCYYS